MRIIDRKYHIQDDQIVKTTKGQVVQEGEPLILFRPRDKLALSALYAYREACEYDGCTQFQMDALDLAIKDFEEFSKREPKTMKQPGCTFGL